MDISVQDGGSKMASNYGGSIYTGTLNSISNDYSDYYFSCLLYAGAKQPERLRSNAAEDEGRYVIVDYTATDVRCPPAQAPRGGEVHCRTRVMKDTRDPSLAVQVVERATGTTSKQYLLALSALVGASGVKQVEVAAGQGRYGGLLRCHGRLPARRGGAGGGWYTVRLTTGMGTVLMHGVEVPGTPSPDPGGDETGGNRGGGSDVRPGAGGSGGSTVPAGGAGDRSFAGSPLAPSGDAAPLAELAALALGSRALLGCAWRRKRRKR